MKPILILLLILSKMSLAQPAAQNIIIITTDGLRWQELFAGMDSAIANNQKFNQGDSSYIYKNYWATTAGERRKKLMPFFWTMFKEQGTIYGNRNLGSKVDVVNKYWFSYPGYSELMTGYPDTLVNSNSYKPNPNVNVLEFLNSQPALKGKVAAFAAWNAFDRILNEQRSGIPVINAFDNTGGSNPTEKEKLINAMLQNSYKPWGEGECLDVFTHYAALEHLQLKKPRVLYIAYGETDEWAHAGMYKNYLDAARQVDKWIEELWNWLQKQPQYAGRTTLLFTTDHGRGDVIKTQWTDHGADIVGANEIFLAAIGPKIKVLGEASNSKQLYQMQVAQTIARIMGFSFEAKHPIAPAVMELFQ